MKKDKFIIDESSPISEWELKPKTMDRTMEEVMELLRKGEEIELTADQMRSYFKSLDNHPKYNNLDFGTKLLHGVVKESIISHKDGGAKTVGKNTVCHQCCMSGLWLPFVDIYLKVNCFLLLIFA